MAPTLLYIVFISEMKTVPKELLSLARNDLFLKTLIIIQKTKKPTLFKYHGNNPQGKV